MELAVEVESFFIQLDFVLTGVEVYVAVVIEDIAIEEGIVQVIGFELDDVIDVVALDVVQFVDLVLDVVAELEPLELGAVTTGPVFIKKSVASVCPTLSDAVVKGPKDGTKPLFTTTCPWVNSLLSEVGA